MCWPAGDRLTGDAEPPEDPMPQGQRDDGRGGPLAPGRGRLIQRRFAEWRLTAAEADVALFAIKGCDVAEIQQLRRAAPGTVRALLTRSYAKAGVNSQSALVALFLDKLIDPAAITSPGRAVHETRQDVSSPGRGIYRQRPPIACD